MTRSSKPAPMATTQEALPPPSSPVVERYVGEHLQRGRSLEERVNAVYRRLLIIRACVNVEEHAFLEFEELADAIDEMAMEAMEDLEPVLHAPGRIANYRPAHDDEDEVSQ